MRYELFIGLRYLRAKRKQAFISVITVMSTLGLIIGVMTLNIVLAVFTGFEENLRDRVLGFNPQVVVLTVGGTVRDPQGVVAQVERVPGVVAAAPFIYGQVILSAQQTVSGAVVRGVGPGSEQVLSLQPFLKEGTVEALGKGREVPGDTGRGGMELPGLIVGKDVGQQLGVRVGDAVTVISPVATATVVGLVPRTQRFAVVGVFDSGMAEYDSSLIYMDLATAQRFFGLDGVATGIEVRGTDPLRAREIAVRLSQTLGFPFRARDWTEMNYNLFAALRLVKTVYFIVLLFIILVAAFNVVSMLIMVVMEKRKDVAILKSLGATRAGVGRIFVYKGMIIAAVGTIVGDVAALLACLLLQRYHFIELPKDIYAIDTLHVKLYPEYFLTVSAAALLLCLFATLYPARQAARLAPVDVIRYE